MRGRIPEEDLPTFPLDGRCILQYLVSADGEERGYFPLMDGLRPTTALACSSALSFVGGEGNSYFF